MNKCFLMGLHRPPEESMLTCVSCGRGQAIPLFGQQPLLSLSVFTLLVLGSHPEGLRNCPALCLGITPGDAEDGEGLLQAPHLHLHDHSHGTTCDPLI